MKVKTIHTTYKPSNVNYTIFHESHETVTIEINLKAVKAIDRDDFINELVDFIDLKVEDKSLDTEFSEYEIQRELSEF